MAKQLELDTMSPRREVMKFFGELGLIGAVTTIGAVSLVKTIDEISRTDYQPKSLSAKTNLDPAIPEPIATKSLYLDNTKITFDQGSVIPGDFFDIVRKFTPFGLSNITINSVDTNAGFSVTENGEMTLSYSELNSSGSVEREIITMLMCGISLYNSSPISTRGDPYTEKELFSRIYQTSIDPSGSGLSTLFQGVYDDAIALPGMRIIELASDNTVETVIPPEKLFAEYLILLSLEPEQLLNSSFPVVTYESSGVSTPVIDFTRATGNLLKSLNPSPTALSALFPLAEVLEEQGYLSSGFISSS